jgi:hypothetical protein
MVLSAQEESLIGVVRTLPPEDAGKVLDWARQLAGIAGGRAIEWSDAWTDEDLADATAAAVQRFEDRSGKTVEARRRRRRRLSGRARNQNSWLPPTVHCVIGSKRGYMRRPILGCFRSLYPSTRSGGSEDSPIRTGS